MSKKQKAFGRKQRGIDFKLGGRAGISSSEAPVTISLGKAKKKPKKKRKRS